MTILTVYQNGNPVRLSDKIGGGLEAEVFRATVNGRTVAAKVFLAADHPSFDDKSNADSLRKGAENRLREQQRKLPELLNLSLPTGIIRPIDLLRDGGSRIVGYTMDPLPPGCKGSRLFADHDHRNENGITNAQIVPLLIELHRIICEGHAAGIIFGDALSGNNVQFSNRGDAWIIDADSVVIPGFPNYTHTREIVDPLLCQPGELEMDKNKSHTEDSDWYGYTVLVAWLLTLAHPYFDGFYLPDDEISEEERAHGGISIFHSDVELPKAAIGPDRLSDDLIAYLREVFEKGRRGEFPLKLLKDITWTTCTCGNSHGRDVCNSCGAPAPGSKRTRQGDVESTILFAAPGGSTIVGVASQNGVLHYASVTGLDIHRENGSTVLIGAMTSPDAQVLPCGEQTAVHDGTTLTVYAADGSTVYQTTDIVPGNGSVGTNSNHVYWLRPDNAVMRTSSVGDKPTRLGVISGPQPRMWIGETFGIALWRQVTGRIYVFDAERSGLTALDLPPVPGDLVDVHCVISSSVAWLFLTLQRGGDQYNYCYAISREGKVLASAEAPCDDGSWLGTGIRVHAVTGKTLFAPTPSGIVRVEIETNSGTAQFAARDAHVNSAPFVQDADRLLLGPDGMLVIGTTQLTQLINR